MARVVVRSLVISYNTLFEVARVDSLATPVQGLPFLINEGGCFREIAVLRKHPSESL